jgi:hypothetical protein
VTESPNRGERGVQRSAVGRVVHDVEARPAVYCATQEGRSAARGELRSRLRFGPHKLVRRLRPGDLRSC